MSGNKPKSVVVVYNAANPAQVERLIRELWRHYSEPAGAWMGETAFGDAVCKILDAVHDGRIINNRRDSA